MSRGAWIEISVCAFIFYGVAINGVVGPRSWDRRRIWFCVTAFGVVAFTAALSQAVR